MRYTANRGAYETVQVLNEVGTAVPISLDRDQIFGADVFSQNEIEEKLDLTKNQAPSQADAPNELQENAAENETPSEIRRSVKRAGVRV
jgi:hypothetical protein